MCIAIRHRESRYFNLQPSQLETENLERTLVRTHTHSIGFVKIAQGHTFKGQWSASKERERAAEVKKKYVNWVKTRCCDV